MFSEFNKIAKSDAFLHNSRFSIAIINTKEIFDKFLAKFISAIASLDFTDCHRICNL